MSSANQELKRILLVRNDRLGDLVLTLPAFEAVRHHWPRAHVTVLASPWAGPLLAGTRNHNEVLIDDPNEGAWRLARRLKSMQFDAAIVFNTSTRNCLAVWLARIPQRVCWAYKPVGLLCANRRVALHRSHPPIHEAAFAVAFVRRLGAAASWSGQVPKLEIDAATATRVAARISRELGQEGPLFGVHPGSKNSAYNWPPSHYAELVCQLAQLGRVMVTGHAPENALLQWIRGRLPDKLRKRVAFFTDFGLLELAAALAEQTALTVSSTGPMHVAGIVGTPVVALFSPHPAHAPAKWAPLGTNHTVLVAPLLPGEDPRAVPMGQADMMSRISVDRVVEANVRYAALAAAAPKSGGPRELPGQAA